MEIAWDTAFEMDIDDRKMKGLTGPEIQQRIGQNADGKWTYHSLLNTMTATDFEIRELLANQEREVQGFVESGNVWSWRELSGR